LSTICDNPPLLEQLLDPAQQVIPHDSDPDADPNPVLDLLKIGTHPQIPLQGAELVITK